MIWNAETVDVTSTQELDRLAQQAALLFVGGKTEQKASRGILDSLPVDVTRSQPPVVPAPAIELPQKTVTKNDTTSSSVKARKPIPVPFSRKLESSIHATGPVVRNNKYASKRAGTEKSSIVAGMGCNEIFVSMRREGKLTGVKDTIDTGGVSAQNQRSCNEFNVSGVFGRTIFLG